MKFLTKHLVVRYVISGGTSASVNIAILSILYYIFHMYYLLASVFAFIVAFFVSLVLQKFWTFRDHSTKDMHLQIGKYLVSSLFGLAINTALLYIFVDHFHFYVFLGQVFAGIITASITFFISRNHVFTNGEHFSGNKEII
ncbi:MAG: GtrA family protein [bacterium]